MTTENKYKLKYLKYKNKYLDLKGGLIPNGYSVIDHVLYLNNGRLGPVFNKLQVEIVTSFMTLYIGMYMNEIVQFYNSIFNTNVRVSEIISEERFQDLVTNGYLNNCLVPVGFHFVHWYYVDNLNYTHNPYSYNMQLPNSHQFCQTHALILAFDPNARQQTDYVSAYKNVTGIWAQILEKINLITPSYDHDAIIRSLYTINMSNEKYFEIINNYYLTPLNIQNIISLIKSEIAFKIAPFFS